MKSTFYFKLYKLLFFQIRHLNRLHFEKFNHKNLKPTFIQIFKSDFLIKFFFSFTLIFLWILSYGFRYLKIVKITLPFLYSRLEEILISSLLIQDKDFSENIKIINHFSKKKTYENIVVGSGPSGSIVAYYLSKSRRECLVIEKARQTNLFKNKHPGKEFLYKWLNSGLNSTIFPNLVSFSSGSCLGGGSEINSGLFHYPTKEFINNWIKEYDVKNLNYKDIEIVFNELFEVCPVSKIDEGQGSKDFFLNGIKKNNYSHEHVASFYKNGNLNNKNSMTKTFLKYFQDNKGEICTNIDVQKIKKNKNEMWDIFAINCQTKEKIVFSAKNVFLNCGSIQTNKLLINSDIEGNYSNFYLHPMIKAIAEFDREVQSGKENVHNYQCHHFFPDFIIGEASSGEQFINMSCYNSQDYSDYISKNWRKMSIYHSTFSIGKGKLCKIPFIGKFIFFYTIDKKELNKITNAMTQTCKILFDGGAKNIYISLNNKLHKFTKNNYSNVITNLKKISSFKFSSVHVLGGVKLGNSNECAFNSFGEHKRLKNLYVSDSSIINHKLLKNPQGTVMYLAYRSIKNFLNKKEFV